MYNGSWIMVTKLDNTWIMHNKLRTRWHFSLKVGNLAARLPPAFFGGPENDPCFLKSREFDRAVASGVFLGQKITRFSLTVGNLAAWLPPAVLGGPENDPFFLKSREFAR